MSPKENIQNSDISEIDHEAPTNEDAAVIPNNTRPLKSAEDDIQSSGVSEDEKEAPSNEVVTVLPNDTSAKSPKENIQNSDISEIDNDAPINEDVTVVLNGLSSPYSTEDVIQSSIVSEIDHESPTHEDVAVIPNSTSPPKSAEDDIQSSGVSGENIPSIKNENAIKTDVADETIASTLLESDPILSSVAEIQDDSVLAVSNKDDPSILESYEDVTEAGNDSSQPPTKADDSVLAVSNKGDPSILESYEDVAEAGNGSAQPPTKPDPSVRVVSYNKDGSSIVGSYDGTARERNHSAQKPIKSDDASPAVGKPSPKYEDQEIPTEPGDPSYEPLGSSDMNSQKSDVYKPPIQSKTDNYGNTSSNENPKKTDDQEDSSAKGTSLRGTLYALGISASGTFLTVIINILANGAVIHCILEAPCMQGCFGRHPWFKDFLKLIFFAAASVAVTNSLGNKKNLLDQVVETASVAKGYMGVVWSVLSSVAGVLTVAGGVVATIFRKVLCGCCYKEKVAQMPEVPERSYAGRRVIDVKPAEYDCNTRRNVDPR
eukprot:818238_1